MNSSIMGVLRGVPYNIKNLIKQTIPDKILIHRLYYPDNHHFNDSYQKLKWKIANGNKDSLYLIKDKNTEKPLCYIIARNRKINKGFAQYKNFKLMTLMDYGYFSDKKDIDKIIIQTVFKLFLNNDAEVLEIITSSSSLGHYSRKMGMFKVGRGMSFKFSIPDHFNIGQDCNEISSWHLTHFSSDAFSFE